MFEPETMNRFTKKILYIVGVACISASMQAQSLDQAKKLYDEGKYEEAKPAFERLVKQSPNNGSYNHWYGVCCYETGDLAQAETYLQVGVRRKVMESSRYLAEVYFALYRFEESAEMYEDYIGQLTKKKQDVEPFQLKKSQAENAQRMLDKVEDVQVIDSVVVDKEGFLKAYALSEESGSLTLFADFFESEQAVPSVVYKNQKGDKIYYARETDDNALCLFTQSYLMDHWGDEKQLPMNVNSDGDDNYPFVLTDGVTIYYASKGNGSLGGYDIFVTRYNMNSDTYLTPEQLGMPYNSFANDYMIVFDDTKKLGWFVSDRYQPEDKVCVYLFIPNEQRKRIESEDTEMKRARAMLADIRVTWKEGEDYSDLIELAYEEIPYGREEIKKDFEFVITNDLVYYTLEEIQSPEARSIYEKVVALNRQIKELEEKLDEQRDAYHAGDNAQKQRLQPQILQGEQQLAQLYSQPEDWEKKARNAEILYLRKNNTR
ncbi:tetratricopeptide repeat protein [Parabacteroides sp. OttesenSCG-928-J18]|nr:tetratricopeptide repeat protein [Parabacteroides sp. OttesenSCG-928-J18]